MAERSTVTVAIPAYNEADIIGPVVTAIAAGGWKEILVVDDGSTDGTAVRAAAAGARVLRHPYNKGNGASVKTAIRAAAGEWIVIVDGDGQHRAEDVARIVAPLGEYDLVVGARAAEAQASPGR